jgi:hypothetical protein
MHERQRPSENKTGDQAWAREAVAGAVEHLTRRGIFSTVTIEARPTWMLPAIALIGEIREQGGQGGSFWFICGEFPTDCVRSDVASTPRAAARHFSLQWQLDADRMGEQGKSLAERAEVLHELAEEDAFWPPD